MLNKLMVVIVFLLCLWAIRACKIQEELTEEHKIRLRLEEERGVKEKEENKIKKQREKYYWDIQTSAVKKSIRKNVRRQKKKSRKLRK